MERKHIHNRLQTYPEPTIIVTINIVINTYNDELLVYIKKYYFHPIKSAVILWSKHNVFVSKFNFNQVVHVFKSTMGGSFIPYF